MLAPLTLKAKHDLRKLIAEEPSWKKPISDEQRSIWIANFKMIEEVRDILYVRCSIPEDAVSCHPRLLLLCDAADPGIMIAVYISFERKNGTWTCDLLVGKGLLAPENLKLPDKELQALSGAADIMAILKRCLKDWGCLFLAFSDSEIAICWTIYEKSKLTTFVRNRVINIRMKMGTEILHHVSGEFNPCDVGTRPEKISADSVRPGSIWMSGHNWMNGSVEDARALGIVKTVEDIRLTNESKKKFKDGISYDTFSQDDEAFAIVQLNTIDAKKMFRRQEF